MEQRLTDIARALDLGQSFVDERVLRGLSDLPYKRVMKLLDDFEINLQQNRQGIRNPAAYLMGMAARVKKQGELPSSGVQAVMAELEVLFQSGHVKRSDVDDRCLDMLRQLPEDMGLQAVAELRSVDTSTVKNMSAFFMSVMKKYTFSPRGGSGPGGGPGGGAGRPYFSGRDGGGGWEGEYGHYPTPRGGGGGGRDEGDFFPPERREQHHHDYSGHRDLQRHSHHQQAPELDHLQLPPPRLMPTELLYGYGADEYIPEIPRVSCTEDDYIYTFYAGSNLFFSHDT